eukprot:scaffold1789_cov375-Prasinococcus_capsulatus_cf.AAC.17
MHGYCGPNAASGMRVLQWLREENSAAPDVEIDAGVLKRLKSFAGMEMVKKMATWIIAHNLAPVELMGLKVVGPAHDC